MVAARTVYTQEGPESPSQGRTQRGKAEKGPEVAGTSSSGFS